MHHQTQQLPYKDEWLHWGMDHRAHTSQPCGGTSGLEKAAAGQESVPDVGVPTCVTLTPSLGLKDDRVTPLTPGPPE